MSEYPSLEKEMRPWIENLFREKCRKLGISATMDLEFLKDFPIIGEYVYGEAFPEQNRIHLEVYAPDATNTAIRKTICEELVHLKHPEIRQHPARFWRMVHECSKR